MSHTKKRISKPGASPRLHGWSRDRWLAYKRDALAYCRRVGVHSAGGRGFGHGRPLTEEIFDLDGGRE